MGWLIVDFAADRMCLIIRCFCEKFRETEAVGGICKSQSADPRPPGADRGMCLLMCRYESLVMIYVVLSYSSLLL